MPITPTLSVLFTGSPAAAPGHLVPACPTQALPKTGSSKKPRRRVTKKSRLVQRDPDPAEQHRFAAAMEYVAAVDLRAAGPSGLPSMSTLELAGLRVMEDGRGTQVKVSDKLRILARYPGLRALSMLYPTLTGGRPGHDPAVWLYFSMVARDQSSFDKADACLRDHWDTVVAPELRAQGYLTSDTLNRPDYQGYNQWRKRHQTPERLAASLAVHRALAVRYAMLMHDLEQNWLAGMVGRHGLLPNDSTMPSFLRGKALPAGGYLDAPRSQLVLADGTVMGPPSGAHINCPVCGRVQAHKPGCANSGDASLIVGSRARSADNMRLHDQGKHVASKSHGRKDGFVIVAPTINGYRPYSGFTLDIDIVGTGTGEIVLAEALLDGTMDCFPAGHIKAVVYDGAAAPAFHTAMAVHHGVPVVNYPSVKEQKPSGSLDTEAVGLVKRKGGHHKGKTVVAHSYFLKPLIHAFPDGTPCLHPVLSEDGMLFLTSSAGKAGDAAKGAARGAYVPVVDVLPVEVGNGDRDLHITVEVPCRHGAFQHTYRGVDPNDPDAGTGTRSVLALVRAAALNADGFLPMYGARNIAESVFSRFERMFYIKDRMSSYGIHHQRADLLGAAMTTNAIAAAHLIGYYGVTASS